MTKYVLYIDYQVTYRNGDEYRTMDAMNFAEAIAEADKIYNPSEMYLVRIMDKEGKQYKLLPSTKSQNYKAVLCKRSPAGGWRANNSENSENEHEVRYTQFNKSRSHEAFAVFDLI